MGFIDQPQNKVYRFRHFPGGIKVTNNSLNSVPIVVAGSKDLNFIVAYERKNTSGETITLTAIQDDLPIIMKDNNDNYYDIFGEVINGPETGSRLSPVDSYIGYWFAWGAFNPGIGIVN